ncbi:MAG: hypothetical protein IPJ17_13985 [Holophagales bacterium]|nr:MAG: hypothetical protein IPJ17_13985 [Holophagales bacterium]
MSDRKYRQRGYQDNGRPESASRQDAPRPDPSLAPRGRGFGAPTASVFRCAACGRKVDGGVTTFDARCPHCAAPLHTCTHCVQFDSSAPKQCRLEMAVRVARKSERNDCAEFAPRIAQEFAQEERRMPKDDPRAAFDALFKI